jgi:hypothetical protein
MNYVIPRFGDVLKERQRLLEENRRKQEKELL